MKTINSTTINKNSQTAKISNPKPSKELCEALQEGEDILNGKIQSKKYHSVKELIEALEESEQIIKDLKSGKRKGYRNMDDLIKSLDED